MYIYAYTHAHTHIYTHVHTRTNINTLKHCSTRKGGTPSLLLGGLDIFALSAVAKLGSTLATYPLLVIKSRLQVGVEFVHDALLHRVLFK